MTHDFRSSQILTFIAATLITGAALFIGKPLNPMFGLVLVISTVLSVGLFQNWPVKKRFLPFVLPAIYLIQINIQSNFGINWLYWGLFAVEIGWLAMNMLHNKPDYTDRLSIFLIAIVLSIALDGSLIIASMAYHFVVLAWIILSVYPLVFTYSYIGLLDGPPTHAINH